MKENEKLCELLRSKIITTTQYKILNMSIIIIDDLYY